MDKYQIEHASEFAEEVTLPDMLNYGDSIVIKGIDRCEITFAIDEIEINPSKEAKKPSIFIYLITKEKRYAVISN